MTSFHICDCLYPGATKGNKNLHY